MLPAKNEYLKRFIEKTEQFIRRLRWKAYYFLNGTESTANESYGFKSRNSTPQISELQPIEEDMAQLIQNIKFKPDTKCSFQHKLNRDIKNKINKKLFLNEIVFRFRKNIESPRTVDFFVHIFWMRSTN